MPLPHARRLHATYPYEGRIASGAGGGALLPTLEPVWPWPLKLSLTALLAGGLWLGWDRLPKSWPQPPPKPKVEVVWQTNVVYREVERPKVEQPSPWHTNIIFYSNPPITNFFSKGHWMITNLGVYNLTNQYATNITIMMQSNR